MKSLKQNTTQGCPFDRSIFTDDIVSHIFKEGFKWINECDSYSERRELSNYGCYYKYEAGNSFDIYIYICEDGIEIDIDLECGGNMRNSFYSFSLYDSFEEVYDLMVEQVNNEK